MSIPKMLKSKKVLAMFPMTIAILLVAGFLLFSMSPVMNDVIIKNASARTITVDAGNYIRQFEILGMPRSGWNSTYSLVFVSYNSGGTVTDEQVRTDIKTTGTANTIMFEASVTSAWFTDKGYTANKSQYMSYCKILITITNPNSVATTYEWPTDKGTKFTSTETFHVQTPNLMSVEMSLTTPYAFNVAGTYTISYTYSGYW